MKLASCISTLFLTALFSTAAHAQIMRTWVSGVGDDANPCTRTAPCKTFAGAYFKTPAGGEIDALDPGGFGGLSINKSITIDGGYNLSSVLVQGTNGFTIAAGPTDVVVLRSIAITGQATGLDGIAISSAGSVRIEKSRIYGFSGAGIALNASGPVSLTVSNSEIHDCSGTASSGIAISGNSTNAVLDAVQIQGCPVGLSTAGNNRVTARNFDFSFNTNAVEAGGTSVINLIGGLIANSTVAVQAGGASVVRLTGNSLFDNVTGLSSTGGTILSFLNNSVKGNANDGNPTQLTLYR